MITVINKYKDKGGVSIMRGKSPLANPYRVSKDKGGYTRDTSTGAYKEWFKGKVEEKDQVIMKELRKLYKLAYEGDLSLSCCCAPLKCHGDTIKEYLDTYLKPKILVCGGRDFKDNSVVFTALDQRVMIHKEITVVSGLAAGADTIAVEWQKKQDGVELLGFPAKWDDIEGKPENEIKTNKYGKKYWVKAGFERNRLMLLHTDIVLAFWDGKSSGTKNMIDISRKAGKSVFVYNFTNAN